MRYVCIYGHTKDGKPVVHASRSRCEIYTRLLRDGKIDSSGNVLHKPLSVDSSASTEPATPDASAIQRVAEPPKPSLGDRLRGKLAVSYAKVGTTSPPAPGDAANEQPQWMVKDETVERFWELVFSLIEQGVNLACKVLQIPDAPHEIFAVDPGQRYVFRSSLRGFTTKVLRDVFMAKSAEDADRIVSGLSFFLGFGLMAVKIIGHFMLHVPKSPRLASWRAKRAELKARKSAREGNALGAAGAQGA